MTPQTLTALLQNNASLQRELKRDRRGVVCLHLIDGQRWIVKRESRSSPALWLQHILRCTSAWRQWRGADRLALAGVRVVRPVALVHQGRGQQALVLPYIDALDLHDWLASSPQSPHTRLRVAHAIGLQIGRITHAGWINRDHKPRNLMIDPACAQRGEQPVLIDPAGIRRRHPRFPGAHAKILGMFHVMLRAAKRAGTVSPREQITLLRAAIAQDPSIGHNPPSLARQIARIANARPLSYDPPSRPEGNRK